MKHNSLHLPAVCLFRESILHVVAPTFSSTKRLVATNGNLAQGAGKGSETPYIMGSYDFWPKKTPTHHCVYGRSCWADSPPGQTGKLGIEKTGKLSYFKNFYWLIFFLTAENALPGLTKVQTPQDIIAFGLTQKCSIMSTFRWFDIHIVIGIFGTDLLQYSSWLLINSLYNSCR